FRTTFVLDDGTPINFRSIHPTDEARFRELFYALSQATVYYRFMSHMTKLSRKQVQDFIYIDHRTDVAIVGTVPEAHGEDIVAIGRYYLDQTTNYAEVAFVVRDTWQNRGIGAFLLGALINIAKRQGIRGFTAEVLRENRPMQAVLNRAPCKVTSQLREGICSYHMDFA
ncbi:MAG: GNAT family N-acetyltransferase, partial [bacterium]